MSTRTEMNHGIAMVNYQLKRVAVRSTAGLSELSDLIHDEAFEVAAVDFDSKLGVVTIPFRRIYHGGPERLIQKTIFSRKREVDVLRAFIRIKHVTDAKIIDTEKIGTYTFDKVAFETETSQLVFMACPKFLLRFRVSSLAIEYEETQFAGKVLITDGWCWQRSRFVLF